MTSYVIMRTNCDEQISPIPFYEFHNNNQNVNVKVRQMIAHGDDMIKAIEQFML